MGCDITRFKDQLNQITAVDSTRTDDNRYRVSVDATAPHELKKSLHALVKNTKGMVWRECSDDKLIYTIIFAEAADTRV